MTCHGSWASRHMAHGHILDQVWTILPAFKLLPSTGYMTSRGVKLQCRQNGSKLGLVNKPNISYRFENILKYQFRIQQKLNIEISELRYRLQYRFKMLLLVWRWSYSDDIFMVDIQTDPIKHQKVKKTPRNEYIEYIGFRFKNIVSVLKFQHLPALYKSDCGFNIGP